MMKAKANNESRRRPPGLNRSAVGLLCFALPAWLVVFLLGTLVDSQPFRDRFASLAGGVWTALGDGAAVVFTYTLTNVAILCILAALLGTLGAKARLGSDTVGDLVEDEDTTAPWSSAVLRGFLIYLALIGGVLLLGESPANPTQVQYVKLAGLVSLAGFIVNYSPRIFAQLLQRASAAISPSSGASGGRK